jgi:hypothetical protein
MERAPFLAGKSGPLRTSQASGKSRVSDGLRMQLLELENPMFLKIAMDSTRSPALLNELVAALDDPDWRVRRGSLWIMDTLAQRAPEMIRHVIPKVLECSQERHRAVSNTAAVVLLELARHDPSWMSDVFTPFVSARIESLDAHENTDAMLMIERFHYVDKEAYKPYARKLEEFKSKQGVNPALQGRARRLMQYVVYGKVKAGVGAPPRSLRSKLIILAPDPGDSSGQRGPLGPAPPPPPPSGGGYWDGMAETAPRFPVDKMFSDPTHRD